MIVSSFNFILIMADSRQEFLVLRVAFSKIDARRFVWLEVSFRILRFSVRLFRVITAWCRSSLFYFLNLFDWNNSAILLFPIALLPFICSDFGVNLLKARIKFMGRSNSSLPFSRLNEATAFLLSVTRFVFLGSTHHFLQLVVIWRRIILLDLGLHEYFSCSFPICGQESTIDSAS